MEINYLLAGLFGEESARDTFERLCALLILDKYSNKSIKDVSENELESFKIEKDEKELNISSLEVNAGQVYHIQTRQGDGGLDIIYENGDTWDIFQCKFYVEGKIGGNTSRQDSIEASFKKAMETAASQGKKVRSWFLCVPLDLDIKDKDWWDTFRKTACENEEKEILIKKLDNLEISKMLKENNNIFNAYFRKLIPDGKSLEINMKLNEYINNLKQEIRNLDDYYFKKPSKIYSLFEEYKEIFSYIKGLQKNFINISNTLRSLETFSNSNRQRYDKYHTEERLLIKGTEREQIFSNNMLQMQSDLKNHYQNNKEKIDSYLNILEEFNNNFDKFFVKSGL
ncbi:hypothetical protein [Priestia sp. YIM B13489]|uniref:hypothetical protein n=1 Tax=Priestia sp. YIM B13489 TaxID=3366313 RepID=UPI0036703031